MGGFAALHDSFLHPDVFSKVGVMSAALWVGGLPAELQWIYSTAADKAARDPITLAENRSIRGLSVFMVEGGSDPFLPADRHLYRELKHRGVPVIYHEYPGGHDYTFWSKHAADLLLFFDGTSGTS
jgi:enterochelin esterase-like enzyme